MKVIYTLMLPLLNFQTEHILFLINRIKSIKTEMLLAQRLIQLRMLLALIQQGQELVIINWEIIQLYLMMIILNMIRGKKKLLLVK